MTLALALTAFHPAALLVAAALLIGFASIAPGNALVTPLGVFSAQAAASLGAGPFVPIAASGAINPHLPGRYVITKAGIAALTLAAPTAGADDGVMIEIISTTAFAHTVTATGLYQDGGGHVNTATFNNQIGASFIVTAYQGKWYVQVLQNVTMS